MKKNGFTLIETVIYLGLFAIIMTGVLTAVYSVSQTGSRNQARAMIQEEGTYLLGKIDWVLSGVKTINLPIGSGDVLQVNTFNGNAIEVGLSGLNIYLSRLPNSPEILNNTNVEISELEFIHTEVSGDGINPESVEVNIIITTRTQDGFLFSQKFSTVKYLHK
ncbi:MAG: type II secretion system protein [Patescibacteria group bacterium]